MADVIREHGLPYQGRPRADEIRVHPRGYAGSRGLLLGLLALLGLVFLALFAHRWSRTPRVSDTVHKITAPAKPALPPAPTVPKLEPPRAPIMVPPVIGASDKKDEAAKKEEAKQDEVKKEEAKKEEAKKEEAKKEDLTRNEPAKETKIAPAPKPEVKPAEVAKPAPAKPPVMAKPEPAKPPVMAKPEAAKPPVMAKPAPAKPPMVAKPTPAAGPPMARPVKPRAEALPKAKVAACPRLDIYFDANQTSFTDKDLAQIDTLATCLKAHPDATVRLEGRNDFKESNSEAAMPLTRQRARALEDALTKRGVNESQLKPMNGPNQCINQDTPACLKKNRSVSAIVE